MTTELSDAGARQNSGTSDAPKPAAMHRAEAVALALLIIVLWCLTHRYSGLVGDAELYAMQALSRLQTGLARDVFLGSSSQDRFTVFSPLYSAVIALLGLRAAALTLLIVFKVSFYAAAWAISRELFDSRTALLTTALLICVPCEYGAYHVFRVSEDMLTARSLAEPRALLALLLQVRGRGLAALAIAGLAVCIHALMALPLLLTLMSLSVNVRTRAVCATLLVAGVLAASGLAVLAPQWTPHFLRLMDADWLEMVRERSQFVFPQLWRLDDWELNVRPFLSLAISMLVLAEARIRSLCASAAMVGLAGLVIALIAGALGPVPILLQAQVWRWTWVAEFASLLLLVPTVVRMWRAEPVGPVCAVLLLVGWLSSLIDGVYCVAAALCLWGARRYLHPGAGPYLRFIAAALCLLTLGWIGVHGWTTVSAASAGGKALSVVRAVLGLDCLPLLLVLLIGQALWRSRSIAMPIGAALALGAAAAVGAPDALRNPRLEGSATQIEEFADWRAVIPTDANVLMVSNYYSAGFTWFTLERPSYLTVDQSSGVIFSQATAAEIRRRSEVLLPLEEPDWRLLSRRAGHGGKYDAQALPLTRERLEKICADPALDFVVAKEDVGFEPLRHDRLGVWKDWNLYDCRQVSSRGSSR